MKLKFLLTKVALISICTLVMGCNIIKNDSIGNPKEKVTVKVLYESESAFFTNYGSLFISKYPNVDFQVIPFPYTSNTASGEEIEQAYDMVIQEEQPDILFLYPDQVERYSNKEQLYDLDPLIVQDKFDLENIHPAVTDYIRSIGTGRLLALTPNFYGKAVFYNKDLFDQYQIPYPNDDMTWEDIMLLAQRFSPESTSSHGIMFGSNQNSLFKLALDIGEANNLTYLDLKNRKITINSDSWKEVFRMVLNAYQSDSIYAEGGGAKPGITYREILLQHPFITNQAAMSVEGHHFLKDLKFAEELNPEATPKWDVIAFPSNDGQLGSEDSIWIQYVVSINAKSTNINTAWEVVKYINSEEFTRAALKSTLQDSLPTRKEVLSNAAYNLDAFYRPSMNPYLSTTNRKISQSFYDSFQSFSEMKVNEALRGGISLDEMLTSIEQKGQELLLQEKTD